MNELGHLSGTTLSNAILDNTTDHTITKTKSSSALYILTTACLRVLPLSSTHRVDPLRLGKAERLSPSLRQKDRDVSPEPNVDTNYTNSVQGFLSVGGTVCSW